MNENAPALPWVSVTERMPSLDKPVLILMRWGKPSGTWFKGWRQCVGWHYLSGSSSIRWASSVDVTHWLDITPPSETGKEKGE